VVPALVLLGVACAGRSSQLDTEQRSSGSGGVTANGGAPAGAAGPGGVGGVGGVGPGGVGGVGAGGYSGSLSQVPIGGACALSLDDGSCDLYAERYGFDINAGHCVKFIWGGCSTNGNNFTSLAECEATCGRSAIAACPEQAPASGETCEDSGLACHYHPLTACLCLPSNNRPPCSQIDPGCSAEGGAAPCQDGDCDPRPSFPYELCQCNGVWSCAYGDPLNP